jgi:serine/threonine-protein kinase
MDTTVADPLVGALIDGRYRVRARLARGGVATVYTATDERLERTVALKIIQPSQARNRQFMAKFTDEAKTIARLTHPNVVAVYDQGTFQGLPYLVMEYVRGRTLREILTERRRLPAPEALAIMDQMLAAIAAAHRAGLVHRDVKPENVLVAEAPGSTGPGRLLDAVVKVADFGLARAVEASADDRGGKLMATVAYVAPELVADGHADPRADVYSAGIVLFEMLTGRVPYEGDKPADVAWQHVDRDVPAPSRFVAGLPPQVDELVARATRREPGDRPTDGGAMLGEVMAVRDDIGTTAALSRIAAAPTVVVPSVEPITWPSSHSVSPEDRPPWARLHPPPGRRAAGRTPGPYSTNFFTTLAAKYRRHPRRRAIAVIAAVLAGLMILTGTWWFAAGRYTEVPSLVSMTKTQAIAAAKKAGLRLRYDSGLFSETIAADTVLKQRPGANARIARGGSITLTLSRGPERYPVPDVVGLSLEAAEPQFAETKMGIKSVEQYSDTVPEGSIMATDPAAGTVVKPGTEVVITVSKGHAPITVPPVVGKSLEEATAVLAGLGLQVKVTPTQSDQPPNQVLTQDPAAGAGVEAGQVVTLTVSAGPPQQPVPDVTQQRCSDAANVLRQYGFNPQIIGFDAASVLRQDPGGGSQAAPGSTVTLWCFGV